MAARRAGEDAIGPADTARYIREGWERSVGCVLFQVDDVMRSCVLHIHERHTQKSKEKREIVRDSERERDVASPFVAASDSSSCRLLLSLLLHWCVVCVRCVCAVCVCVVSCEVRITVASYIVSLPTAATSVAPIACN